MFLRLLLPILLPLSLFSQAPDIEHIVVGTADDTIKNYSVLDRTGVNPIQIFFGDFAEEVLIQRLFGEMRDNQDNEARLLYTAIKNRREAENIRIALRDSLDTTIGDYFDDIDTRNNRHLDGTWTYQIVNQNGVVTTDQDIVIDSLSLITDPGGQTVGSFMWISNKKISVDIPSQGINNLDFYTIPENEWLAEDPTNDRITHIIRIRRTN